MAGNGESKNRREIGTRSGARDWGRKLIATAGLNVAARKCDVWCYVRVAGNSECGRVAVRNRAGRGDGDFDPAWLAKRGWQVVPVETERSHLSDEEIDRVVPVLNKAGHLECLAVATEELRPRPACCRIELSRQGIVDYNVECCLLGYMLMNEAVRGLSQATVSTGCSREPPKC